MQNSLSFFLIFQGVGSISTASVVLSLKTSVAASPTHSSVSLPFKLGKELKLGFLWLLWFQRKCTLFLEMPKGHCLCQYFTSSTYSCPPSFLLPFITEVSLCYKHWIRGFRPFTFFTGILCGAFSSISGGQNSRWALKFNMDDMAYECYTIIWVHIVIVFFFFFGRISYFCVGIEIFS